MAESYNDCVFLSINGSANLADHLVSVPMLNDGIRSTPLTPKDGYARSGGVLHDAALSFELYADEDDDSVTEVLLGTRGDATKPGIRGVQVNVHLQEGPLKGTDGDGAGAVAGTATANDPICEFPGTCFAIPDYPGGAWGDNRRFVLTFAAQGKYDWKVTGTFPT